MRRTFPLADEYETDSIENKRFQSAKTPDARVFDEISYPKMKSNIDPKYRYPKLTFKSLLNRK
jgi:hypothetical protein